MKSILLFSYQVRSLTSNFGALKLKKGIKKTHKLQFIYYHDKQSASYKREMRKSWNMKTEEKVDE
jgi:hypothetical protein